MGRGYVVRGSSCTLQQHEAGCVEVGGGRLHCDTGDFSSAYCTGSFNSTETYACKFSQVCPNLQTSVLLFVYTSLKIRTDFLPISRTATETVIKIRALSTLKVRVYLFFLLKCQQEIISMGTDAGGIYVVPPLRSTSRVEHKTLANKYGGSSQPNRLLNQYIGFVQVVFNQC
jgi:hypothetical protein